MRTVRLAWSIFVLPALVSWTASGHNDDLLKDAKSGRFGRVLFKTSCTAEAQQQFDRALAMLHSFYFPETVKAFNAIAETDPECAIAYWGLAMSQRPNPLVGPFDAATLKRGLDAIEKGEAIGAKTARERDWLAAIKAFYKDYDKVDQDTRARATRRRWGRCRRSIPTTWRPRSSTRWRSTRRSITSRWRRCAGRSILEPLDKKYPTTRHHALPHPLATTSRRSPSSGIPAANKYAKIAPAAPHAQHMPSHIYSMVGMWQDSIDVRT